MKHSTNMKSSIKRGLWSPEEDEKLARYITTHGRRGCWSSVPKLAGLQRCGKSCRLRWINYLRPGLKRGTFSSQEATLIIHLHNTLGNKYKWAEIARYLPGRTDSAVKNFCNSNMKKKLLAATPINDHTQTYIDKDHQIGPPSMLLEHDQEIENGMNVDAHLPPLPPSFMGGSYHVLDQHVPENFDFINGQTTDPNHPIMQFEPCEMSCVDWILNSQPNVPFLDVIP